MLTEYAHRTRAERLVAAGRLVLAVFSLFAIWVDPSEPAKWSEATYALLAAYVVYAGVLAALAWRSPRPLLRLRLATHVADIVIFTVVIYLTEGPTSPFFVYFIFSLLCATIRFGSRGTIATAVAATAAFATVGGISAKLLHDPAFELNRFIIRSVYLAVAAALLVHLGAYQERLRRELTRLASWPRAAPEDPRALIEEALANAAAVLHAPRVLLVWEEEEEPWLRLAILTPGGVEILREPPGAFEPVVAPELSGVSFLCREARAAVPVVATAPHGAELRPAGPPIHPGLADRFAIDGVLCLHIEAQRVEARLLALDRNDLTSDDLLPGEVVAGLVGARLDQLSLVSRLKESAATAERVRVARDLHDGVLQDLAGIALQLEALRPLLVDTSEARKRLDALERVLETEQRDVRSVIQQLRPSAEAGDDFDLAANLEELRESFAAAWNVDLELSADGVQGCVPSGLKYDLFRIVHEAVSNAARHAEACRVRVALALDGEAVEITAVDDGRGFPFVGRYDLGELNQMRLGPVTLKERIGALGGSLVVESTPRGSTLRIRLPFARPL